MDNTTLLTVGAVILLLHILMNAHISKEIYHWVPSIQKRLVLFFCVWFVPFVGIAIAYKILDLDWFMQKSKNASSGQSSIGGAILEVDAIFNPGQKHVIAAQQKEVIEKREDGDMYNKGKPDLNVINSENVSDKRSNTL